MIRRLLFYFFLFVAAETKALCTASLTGDLSLFLAYQNREKTLRHQRYALRLRQTARLSSRLATVLEGRVRTEAQMWHLREGDAPPYSTEVVQDEANEYEVRNGYFDYLNNYLRVRAGMQQIDWTQALAPASLDLMVPIDRRHDARGGWNEILEPVLAASVGANFLGTSAEVIVVPSPKGDRLAKGVNGYLAAAELYDSAGGLPVVARPLRAGRQDLELGARLSKQVESLEATVLAMSGHHRRPVMAIQTQADGSQNLLLSHPRVTTYGATMVWAGEALVLRAMYYVEPNRHYPLRFASTSEEPDVDLYTRGIHGVGGDYVHSKHFKIYSEFFLIFGKSRSTPTAAGTEQVNQAIGYSRVANLRVTNESFRNLTGVIEASYHTDLNSTYLNPRLSWTPSDTDRLELGAHTVLIHRRAASNQRFIENLRKTDDYFLSWSRFLDAKGKRKSRSTST